MWSDVFILGLAFFLAAFLRWAFRTLPNEGWQMLAAIPVLKQDPDTWYGINFTYYGVLVAASCVFSTALALVLMGSIGVPGLVCLLIVATILGLCMPAARIVAGYVERRKHTLTIAGPSFVGIVTAPAVVWLADQVFAPCIGTGIPLFPVLAALSVAYAMGEGLGRLACISFGCCYGRPLADCHPLLQRAFARYGFIFSGKTKKIAYESGLEGEPVIPIQAITSIVFVTVAVLGMLLYFKGWYAETLIVSITVTQLWRIISEILRSDYRGESRWSVYQGLAFLAVLYCVVIYFVLPPGSDVSADLVKGLETLWNPAVILLLLAVFAATFLWTGWSTVTASTIAFHVRRPSP
ncbi:MAG: prolipoprotein diacylglyceryl transferase family protein [Thermodesulfobacteriota bacterium]